MTGKEKGKARPADYVKEAVVLRNVESNFGQEAWRVGEREKAKLPTGGEVRASTCRFSSREGVNNTDVERYRGVTMELAKRKKIKTSLQCKRGGRVQHR